MPELAVNFNFALTGDLLTKLQQINSTTDKTTQASEKIENVFSRIGKSMFWANQINDALSRLQGRLEQVVAPGAAFDLKLHELSAITGVTGKQLDEIAVKARQTSKEFGVSGAQSLTSYKLILSQLGPELAQNSTALSTMGKNIATLSKTMGNDQTAAAEVLTTAMNQYGVSLEDPIRASRVMSSMMNVMAAAAKEGSAELPQIKMALEQTGMVAKTVGVSFEEMNAAIQVLDKAGKKGAEGGVALRNVLSILSQGKLLPRETLKLLEAGHVDIKKLGDSSLTLSERLRALKPVVGDAAIMSNLFGRENFAAGIALINGTEAIDYFNKKITGTTSAVEQADIVMSSWEEKQARRKAFWQDLGVSIFSVTKNIVPFVQLGASVTGILGDIGAGAIGFSAIADTKLVKALRSSTVGMWNFIRAGSVSLVNMIRQMAVTSALGVMMAAKFVAGIVSATIAQWGLNAAFLANPITWIVLGIMAAIGAIYLMIKYWDQIKKWIGDFIVWILKNNPWAWMIDIVDRIFPGFKAAMAQLWLWIKEKIFSIWEWVKKVWEKIKSFLGFGSSEPVEANINENKNLTVNENKNLTVAQVEGKSGLKPDQTGSKTSLNSKVSQTSMDINGGGSKPTNINITIGKLQDHTIIQAQTVKEGAQQMDSEITNALLRAVNSMNTVGQ